MIFVVCFSFITWFQTKNNSVHRNSCITTITRNTSHCVPCIVVFYGVPFVLIQPFIIGVINQCNLALCQLYSFHVATPFKKVAGRLEDVLRARVTTRNWRRFDAKLKRPVLPTTNLTLIEMSMASKERAGTAIKDGLLVESLFNKLVLISVMPIYYGYKYIVSIGNYSFYRKFFFQ